MPISKDGLVNFLQNELGLDPDKINESTLLFTDGLLDSFSVGGLLAFLEEKGGFVVEAEEVILENIDTIEFILQYAASKTAASSSQGE